MTKYSQQFIQRRRLYMTMPLLVIPFMTMFFWALRGGKGGSKPSASHKGGINANLPGAIINEDINAWDKLSLYQKAKRDSTKVNQAKNSDPYFRLATLQTYQDTAKRKGTHGGSINSSLGGDKESVDETEVKIQKMLSELQRQIDKSSNVGLTDKQVSPQKVQSTDIGFQNDVDRLEGMMLMMQEDPAEDQEMHKIDGVLNKILDIQHPDRVQERQRISEQSETKLSVNPGNIDQQIGLLGLNGAVDNDKGEGNGFYGLESAVKPSIEFNAIRAEVYGNQDLVNGAIIKIELLQSITIDQVQIPSGQFVFGTCSINGERLNVDIKSIQYSNSIFPVSMTVYDIDGIEGIHVPGAITRDAAKKTSNQAINDIQLNSLDQSLEVQAAGVGVEAAKGVLSRKAQLIQVKVKAGYNVFLKNNN